MSKPSTVTALYDGGDRLQIRVPGHELWADQPLDEGRSHRRDTDGGLHRENLQLSLVDPSGLAGCVAFYAERFLRRHSLFTDGLTVTCNCAWRGTCASGEIVVGIEAPSLPPEHQEVFARVVERCPIHNTLQQPPEARFTVRSAAAMTAA